MGLHRKESQSFNGFGKILTKTIKITKTEIETKEKPQILHFQVKNTGFCQQSEISICLWHILIFINVFQTFISIFFESDLTTKKVKLFCSANRDSLLNSIFLSFIIIKTDIAAITFL